MVLSRYFQKISSSTYTEICKFTRCTNGIGDQLKSMKWEETKHLDKCTLCITMLKLAKVGD